MRVAIVVSMLLLAGCARTEYFDSNPGALKSIPEDVVDHSPLLYAILEYNNIQD